MMQLFAAAWAVPVEDFIASLLEPVIVIIGFLFVGALYLSPIFAYMAYQAYKKEERARAEEYERLIVGMTPEEKLDFDRKLFIKQYGRGRKGEE